MFGNISFSTFGRCTKNKDWYIAPLSGVSRIYYIHSGSVLYSSGKSTHMLTSGRLYLFPPNLKFELLTDEDTCIDHTYFDFFSVPPMMMEDILELDISQYPLIRSAADILISLADTSPSLPLKGDKLEELVKSYLNNLLSIINAHTPINTIHDAAINSAIEYIHNNFSSEISVSGLARKFNFEKNVFIRRFKKYTNITPYQYIKNHRINIAVSMIRDGGCTLAEVAEAVGYSDAPSLSHAIKSVLDRQRKLY